MTDNGQAGLTRLQLASYSAPAIPLALVGLPLVAYVPAIYADSDGFGLSLGLVGLMITLSRFTDVVTDPIIGFLSDRWRSKWGRRKPFMLIGMPIYAAGVWLLFVPPVTFSEITVMDQTFNYGYLYLFTMVALVYLGSTIKDLPYMAWGAELSRNFHERTRITSWRESFSVAGALIAAFTPAVILFFGYTKPVDAVWFLAVTMTVIMPVVVINAVAVVPEYPVAAPVEKLPLKHSLKIVMQNRPYVRLIIIFALASLGSAMTASLAFFFVKHVLLAGDLFGLYIAPYYVSTVIAIPIWFKLSKRIGKHKTVLVAVLWFAFWASFVPVIALTPYSWYEPFEIPKMLAFLPSDAHAAVSAHFEGIPTGKFLFFVILMCFKGSTIGAFTAIPASMAADVIDVDTAQTGQQRAGAYFSIWSMIRKLAYALGVTVATTLVVWSGFDSLADPLDSTNSAFSLLVLTCAYSVVPALFKLLTIPILWNYELTEERVSELQAQAGDKFAAA
jgi:GPH family glycoside/pentoside/hexuronide:cation symporter